VKKIVLIACASKKRAVKSTAAELYASTLFKFNLQYARTLASDAIFILSAKHGVLALDEEIEPYDVTLNSMRANERRVWASEVIKQLEVYADLQQDHFIILAGERYRQYLLPYLASFEIPLEGLTIGRQLQYLKKQVRGE